MPKPRKASIPKKTAAKRDAKVSVSLRFSPAILARLDATAEKKGTDRTALVQLAVAEWLEKLEKENLK
jgi:predicted transcriptional regulator